MLDFVPREYDLSTKYIVLTPVAAGNLSNNRSERQAKYVAKPTHQLVIVREILNLFSAVTNTYLPNPTEFERVEEALPHL